MVITNIHTMMEDPTGVTLRSHDSSDQSKDMDDEEKGIGEDLQNSEDTCSPPPASRSLANMARYQHRAIVLSFLILCIGLGAGLAFLFTGIQNAKQIEDRQFEKRADEVTKSFELSWAEFRIALVWMHGVCHGRDQANLTRGPTPAHSIGCTRKDFFDFFDYISESDLEFRNIAWVSNVTQAERAALEQESRAYYAKENRTYKGIVEAVFNKEKIQFEPVLLGEKPWYFVQHYMFPLDETSALFLDQDVSTSKTMWPLYAAALDSMKPTVTWGLPMRDDLSYYIQMYYPGIRHRVDPVTNGVASAMVRVFNLLARATRNKREDFRVFVYDVTDVEKKESTDVVEPAFLAGGSHNGGIATTTEIAEIDLESVRASSSRIRETVIFIEDRLWLVVVADPEGAVDPSIVVPVVGGVVIILASLIIAVWFMSSTQRAIKIQRIHAAAEAEKAALLEEINKDLNRKVEQRVKELQESTRVASEKARETEQAEARIESMVQTMSMLSHELRTPLQGIMGITSMVLADYNNMQERNKALESTETATTTSTLDESEVTPLTAGGRLVLACGNGRRAYEQSDSGDDGSGSSNSASAALVFKAGVMDNLYTIQASSQTLLTLINNLLDIRKISSGMMENFEVECLDLVHIVQQCVDTLKPLSALSDVTLRVGPAISSEDFKTHWLALGSVLPVQQVLVNLVGNAIKYSSTSLMTVGEPTTLDINIRRSTIANARREVAKALCSHTDKSKLMSFEQDGKQDDEVLIVDVRDRGNGIPVEEASKVFAPFMMLKKHAGKQGKGFAQPTGSGLGLQLCGNMMEMMNGCIWANNCDSPEALGALEAAGADKSTDVDGCVFSFYLKCPNRKQADEYIGSSEASGTSLVNFVPDRVGQSNKPSTLAYGQQRRHYLSADLGQLEVLVVDDTLINLKVISRMLTALGCRHVRSATSGARALQLLEEKPLCDLILTDYQMPGGMDGLEFAAKVNEFYSQSEGSHCPLIALCSADYSPSLTALCAESGIDQMLRKPIKMDDLSHFLEENTEKA